MLINLDFINRSSKSDPISKYKFGVLARIVKHMKNRHLDGNMRPLDLYEILNETNQLNIGADTRQVCGCD